MKKGITVIVCTYNGALRLPDTLKYLAAQEVSDNLEWEILLADNASTDHSAEIAAAYWNEHNIKNVPLTLIQESTPGKLYALQKGIALAKYEYFIICDDDNWLDSKYVQTAFDILDENDDIGALGGQAKAATGNSGLPEWFEPVQEGYAIGTQSKNTGDVTFKGRLWGAGLSSRTQLYLDAYRNFPSLLINKSDHKILTAEDTEYCLRLVLKGYKLYYDPRLSLQHYIPEGRLTLTYKNSLFENFRKSNLIIDNYYLAIKYGPNNKLSLFNKIRLRLITPIRYIFSSSPQKKSRQRRIMCYLFPFVKPDRITTQIKAFINN
ncbi:glycosyltransferase [Pedobacter frigoris]|uniref:Glycosyltransferase family 2 protein n=1 Tax=Pedobacter frigoris TaxID=2571272 RepID=A0A4U1CDM5_9SPHI|nr:glycosyltransferase [Pedobacter frigoris]TKC02913.1 glycosyltransferase family 2 protein [Pedobacter frigoris]